MPEKRWRFMALSVTPEHEDESFHGRLRSNTVYLGSRTLEEGVFQSTQSLPEADRFVEVDPFPPDIVRGTHSYIVARTKEKIREQVVKAQQEGRGLILSFSAWGGQQSLDVMEYLDFTRKISDGRVVCIVGGPGLSVHSPEEEADLFAAGADIINLGGGRELAEWLGHLTKNDVFQRDAKGNLIASVPENAPFFLSSSKNDHVKTGGDLPVPVFYDVSTSTINVILPHSGCVNGCDFCAVANSLVCPRTRDAESPAEIAKQVNDMARDVRKMYARIGWDPDENPPYLHILNPNPTQGQGIVRLEEFLSMIDLTKSLKMIHFFDALSFRTAENMERHLAYVEKLLTKNPKLDIFIGVSMDALGAENDGDFMGRRIAGRLVTQGEYDAILKNYHLFLERISGKDWAKRLAIGINQIHHPGMTADVYKLKYTSLLNENAYGFRREFQGYSLSPFNGTPIFEKYKGHFAPPYYMAKDWELGYAVPSGQLSYWGNQFMNGDLLDCVECCQSVYAVTKDEFFLYMKDAIVGGWDEGKAKFIRFQYEDNEEGRHLEKVYTDVAQKILDTKPRMARLMKLFVAIASDLPAENDLKIPAFQAVNAAVHWILRRERYLAENNPLYANNPNCQYLIKTAEEMREKLLASPYADKFDLRAPRNPSLNNGNTSPAPL